MVRVDVEWRILPIEGLVLRELVVAGNGKDAEVRVVVSDGRCCLFESRDPCLKIAVQGAVLTEVTGPDDATLALRYTASLLVLREARVLYPGSAEEWASDMEALNRGVLMSSAIQDTSFTLLGEESA